MLNIKNKKARVFLGFTLAEVLVTLGIIGVVSALTIPSLTKNHQRKVYVTQLQKFYNELSQAGESFINANNAVNLREAGVRSQARIDSFVQSQIKVAKNCGTTFTNCFASEYENMNGSSVTNYDASTSSCYALPSGASMCLSYNSGQKVKQGEVEASFDGVINVVVDVNGKQGPNILGRDLYTMVVASDGSASAANNPFRDCTVNKSGQTICKEGAATDLEKCQDANAISVHGEAARCFTQILNDGWQMEY